MKACSSPTQHLALGPAARGERRAPPQRQRVYAHLADPALRRVAFPVVPHDDALVVVLAVPNHMPYAHYTSIPSQRLSNFRSATRFSYIAINSWCSDGYALHGVRPGDANPI